MTYSELLQRRLAYHDRILFDIKQVMHLRLRARAGEWPSALNKLADRINQSVSLRIRLVGAMDKALAAKKLEETKYPMLNPIGEHCESWLQSDGSRIVEQAEEGPGFWAVEVIEQPPPVGRIRLASYVFDDVADGKEAARRGKEAWEEQQEK